MPTPATRYDPYVECPHCGKLTHGAHNICVSCGSTVETIKWLEEVRLRHDAAQSEPTVDEVLERIKEAKGPEMAALVAPMIEYRRSFQMIERARRAQEAHQQVHDVQLRLGVPAAHEPVCPECGTEPITWFCPRCGWTEA